MTTPIDPMERRLPATFTDLAAARTPDYLIDILGQTARTRQRPAWTFPGRWFPMADIARRPAFMPRLPMRTIAVALVIIALLVGAAVAVIGSRPGNVPPPFGPARNGLIAYEAGGDIYTADPVTGASTAVVKGPENDATPVFSRDGSRLAFMRESGTPGLYAVMVAGRDGSNPRIVTTTPITLDDQFEWTADSASIIVYSEPRLLRVDAVGSAPPIVISQDVYPTGRLGSGGQILYQPASIGDDALWVMNIDGSGAKELVRKDALTSGDGDLGRARFSPDSTKIAFQQFPPGDNAQLRIYLMNADGTGVHALDNAPGKWRETDLRWSPDGERIAFNRSRQDASTGTWVVQPIGVALVATGSVVDAGPTPGSDGATFEWAPDGSTVLSLPKTLQSAADASTARPLAIDPVNGTSHELGVTVSSQTNWQRLAP